MIRIGRGSKGAVAVLAFMVAVPSVGQALAQQPVFRKQVQLQDASTFSGGAQDVRFEGAAAQKEMGSAVVFGDFNNDGFQDLAVGERKSNKVYIYFGRTVLTPSRANPSDPNAAYVVKPAASTTNDVPDVTISCSGCQLSATNNSDFGFSLAAGDVTDDAFADLIIGAPFDDAGGAAGADRGRAFIVEGRGVWPATLDADGGPQTHTITATTGTDARNTAKYYLGFALAVGDFTGDGVGDLAISSRGANFPLYAVPTKATTITGGRAGAVHLIEGASFSAAIDIRTDSGVGHIAGDAANDFFGESLAFCNVDGTPGQDLLIGAIGADNGVDPNSPKQLNAGAMYVYKGTTLNGAGGGIGSAIRGAAADSKIFGADKDDSLGFTVACGDINGDGFDDPMASAFFASGLNNKRPGVGEVFAFYGQTSIPDPNTFPAVRNLRIDAIDPNTGLSDGVPDLADLWIIGSTQGDQLGFSLASGNVNCDPNMGNPLQDIIVGARRYDSGDPNTPAAANVGVTYAIRGSATRPRKFVLDLAVGTVNSNLLLNRPGNFPSMRSDVQNPNVVCNLSNPDDPNGTCAVISIILGDKPHAQTGFSSATGDFNGDGCAEIAIGAVGDLSRVDRVGKLPSTYTGRVFVASLRDNDGDFVSDLSDEDNDNDCLSDIDPNEPDRLVSDSDGDGLQDGTEVGVKQSAPPSLRGEFFFNDPNGTDTCLGNSLTAPKCCLDRDNTATTTDPTDPNSDSDGIVDGDEDSDHNGKLCGDTNSNGTLQAGEFICERDPNKADTDGDGVPDNLESLGGCPSPLDADSDDDGIPDGCIDGVNGAPLNGTCTDLREGEDLDKDGSKDATETNSCLADTDGDGLLDGTEAGVPATGGMPGPNGDKDPNTPNADGTNFSLFKADQDTNSTTDPLQVDTDNDCLPDGCIAGFNGGGPCPPVNPNLPVLQGEDVNLNGTLEGTLGGSSSSPSSGAETDPFDNDTDGDGLQDGLEWGVTTGVCPQKDACSIDHTDPRDSDTDNGSVADGLEDINANGCVDFNQNTFVCGATQLLDVNNETSPLGQIDDRGSDYSRSMVPNVSDPNAPAPNFADPNSVTVTAYLQNKMLVVLLDDTDENKDPGTAEQITINASNVVDPNFGLVRQGIACLVDDPNAAGNVDIENITLTETGPNTHIFKGSVNTTTAGGVAQDGTLNCVENDRVKFAYRDDDDLCDQRNVFADVTLTQIRTVNPAKLTPPITTAVTTVSAIFKEDLSCASVTSGDFTVAGTMGPAGGALTCTPDPGFPLFGNRQTTLTFGAPLPDDLYTVTLDCDAAPPPFIADMSGFAADCEMPCMLPGLPFPGHPAGYCGSVLSGDGAAGGTFAYNFVVDNDSSPSVAAIDPNDTQISPTTRTTVTGTFSEAMDPNTIGTGSFLVTTTMATVSCSSVTYDPVTKRATCNLAGLAVPADDRYMVTLKGAGATPMRDFATNPLDGNNDMTTGDDFMSTFVVDTDTSPNVKSIDPNDTQIITPSRPNLDRVAAMFLEAMDPATISASGANFTVVGTMMALSPSTVSYDPLTKVATFVNSGGTLVDDRYTVTLFGNGGTPMRDFAAHALDGDGNGAAGGNFVSSFVIDYDQVPAITMTLSPATAVTTDPNVLITFKFDQSMEAATVTNPANWSVAGTMMTVTATSISYDPVNKTVTFDPNGPLPDDFYTVTLTGMTDQAGNLLDGDGNNAAGGAFVLNFAVDADSTPNLAAIDPNDLQTITPSRPNLDRVAARFAEAMDANTITAASFTVTGTMMVLTPSGGTVPYDPGTKTASFISSAGILADDRYTVTLFGSGGSPIKDFAGNPLDGDNDPNTTGGNFVSTFVIDYDQVPSVTVVLSPPAAVTLDPNVNVTIKFDQAMEPSTVTDPNHWSLIGTMAMPFAGAITYDAVNKTATFDPTLSLPDDRYTVTFSNATDQAGNILDGDGVGGPGGAFMFNFVVDADNSPTVTATDPNDLEVLTAARSMFTVTFSESMDGTRITPSTVQIRDNVDPTIVLNTLPGSVVYDPTMKTATITTDFALGNGSYQFFLDGTTGIGVADLNGNLLDGDGGGIPGGDFTSTFTIAVTGVFIRAAESQPGLNEVFADPNIPNDQVRVRVTEHPETGSVDPNTYLITNSAADVTCGTFSFADQGSGSSKCKNCNLLCNLSPTTLPDDKYTVTLKGDPNNPSLRITAKTNPATNFLNGECTGGVCDDPNTDFPTGDPNAGGDFSYDFYIDADTLPVVKSIAPLDLSTVADANTNVDVTFSQRMDLNTLNATTFKLVPMTGGGGSVAASYTFDPNLLVGTLDPSLPLDDDTYTVTLVGDANSASPSVRDFSFPVGNALDGDLDATNGGDFTTTFTLEADSTPTVVSTDPANGTTVLMTPGAVTATFSEPMNGSTITASTFFVTSTMGTVSCSSVGYTAATRTATCMLTGFGVPPDDLFTVTLIGNGGSPITDLVGNPLDGDNDPNTLGGDFFSTFVLDTDMTPTVTAIDPADLDVRTVAPSQVVATFSEPMNPASLTPSTFLVTTTMGGVGCSSVMYDPLLKTATCSLAGLASPPDDLYTVTLLGTGMTHITDFAGNPLDGDNDPNTAGGDFVSTFVVDTDNTPTVVATDPNDAETANTPRTTVTADFSEAMDPASIDASTILMTSTTTSQLLAPDTVSYVPAMKRAVFTVTTGIPDDTWTLTVMGTGSSKVLDFNGNSLGADFTATFTIETADPTVAATDPNDAEIRMSAPTQVVATFSEPMDATTITTSTFQVSTTMGGVSCTMVTYDPNTEKATCTLSALASPPDDKYTILLKGTGGTPIQDLAGNPLNGGVSDFTSFYVVDTDMTPTVTATNPPDDPNGASPLMVGPTSITADFSEAMDGSTIDATTFLVDGLAGSVTPTTVMYDAVTKRATFTAPMALTDDTYTITIKGAGSPAASDFAGNGVGGGVDFTSTFSVNVGAPTVTAVDPNDLQVKTTTVTTVAATFSEVMNTSTITTSSFLVSTTKGTVTCNSLAFTTLTMPSRTKATCTLAGVPGNPDDLYTVTLKGTGGATIKDSTNVVLDGDGVGGPGGDFVSTFVVDTDTTPTVTTINPANNAVPTTTQMTVVATFSEPMNGSTIDSTDFLVTTTVGTVSCGMVSYNPATLQATCTLSGLEPNPDDKYTVMVKGSAGTGIKDLRGNLLTPDFSSSFVVDTDTTPTLDATDPNDNETRTTAVTTVTAVFSEAMDPTTITNSSFTVTSTIGTVSCVNPVGYDPSTRTATCTLMGVPANPDDTYTLTLSPSGNRIRDFNAHSINGGTTQTRTFTVDTDMTPTVVSINPVDGDVRTSNVATVSAVFSEAMDSSTINMSSFLLTTTHGNTTCSAVNYTASTKTASCTVSNPQTPDDDRYTVFLDGTIIKDRAGNFLDGDSDPNTAGGDFTSTFIVDTNTSPTVTASNPGDGVTIDPNVPTVTATFSEPMDPNTITTSSFTVTTTQGTVSCMSVSYIATLNRATCTLQGQTMPPDDKYTLMLLATITDLNGNALTPSTRTYIVDEDKVPAILSVNPANGSSTAGVTDVVITFDQAMDPATITTTTFTVRDMANALVPGTVSYNAALRQATFTPTTSPFPASGNPYAVNLDGSGTPAVKDHAAHNIDGDSTGAANGDFDSTFSSTVNSKRPPGTPFENGTLASPKAKAGKKPGGKGKRAAASAGPAGTATPGNK